MRKRCHSTSRRTDNFSAPLNRRSSWLSDSAAVLFLGRQGLFVECADALEGFSQARVERPARPVHEALCQLLCAVAGLLAGQGKVCQVEGQRFGKHG